MIRTLLRAALLLATIAASASPQHAAAQDTFRTWRTPNVGGYFTVCSERQVGAQVQRILTDVRPDGSTSNYAPTPAEWKGRGCVTDPFEKPATWDDVTSAFEAADKVDCAVVARNRARMSQAQRDEVDRLNALAARPNPCLSRR